MYGDSTCGQRAVYEVGLTGIPVFNVNNNCSTGSTALFLARQAVSGGADVVLGGDGRDRLVIDYSAAVATVTGSRCHASHTTEHDISERRNVTPSSAKSRVRSG